MIWLTKLECFSLIDIPTFSMILLTVVEAIAMPYYAMLHHAVPCCAMLNHAAPCHAGPCHAAHVVPCGAMLHYATLNLY
jgi:hypothetical protein